MKKILLFLLFLLLFPLITINNDKEVIESENLVIEVENLEESKEIVEEIIEKPEFEEIFYEEGIASFYGGKFHGRKTASGEVFDTYKITAAHKKLPFGTIVKVENVNNGKSIMVRINDRGPFIKGRVIDLSTAAFKEIEDTNKGITKVRLYIVKELKDETSEK